MEHVFRKLNVNCPIIEKNRRGKFIEDRQRKLIATFSSPWDARLVISSAIQKKLFETDKILITTDLSPSDLAIERKLLSKRFELKSKGVPKETLKIRYLKLYQGNKEVNVDWLNKAAKSLLINCQSLLSLNRRLSLLWKVNFISADIVLCTETWLDENFTQNIFPDDNYSIIIRSDRYTGSHGDVLVLSRNCLNVRKVSLNADFICSVINNNVLFITIYNPPFTSDCRIKDIILTENIDKTISKAKCENVIIRGDFNMPKIDWNNMTESTTSEYPFFLEMLSKSGYEQIITSPTHQSGNILHCVLINYGSTHFTIVEISFSDHYFVEFDIPRTHSSCDSTSQPILSLKPDYPILNQCIGSNLISSFIPDRTAYYSHWIGELTSIIQPFFKRKRQRKTQFPSFYSSHNIHMLNKLHTTHKRNNRQLTYIPTPSVQILTTNVQESISLDTHIVIEKFAGANLNVNGCYKLINSFQRSNKSPACMTLNDEILIDDLNKANGFNKHFCSVFMRDSLTFSDFSENTLNNIEITTQDVDKALRQTKHDSSTDAINGDFILQISNALGIHYHNLLKNLLNHS